jgi:Leucine-rich repeat (LRR) protein
LIPQSDIPNTLSDIRALTSLNISDNDIGKLSPDAAKLDAADWKYKKAKSGNMAYFKDGKGQREAPTECLSPLGAIALANAIPVMRAMTSLNVSNNSIGLPVPPAGWNYQSNRSPAFRSPDGKYQHDPPSGTTYPGVGAIANAIRDMGAILSVNLLENDIGVEQARALVIILKEHSTLKSLCGNNGDETELDMSGKIDGTEDAIMLAAEIIDNGALSFLDMSNNNLGTLVPPAGWTGPDAYGRYTGPAGERQSSAPPGSKAEGAIAIADVLPGMGAISSVNLLENDIGTDQAEALASILKEHPTLKSLCGNRGDETELDMRLGADGAIMFTAEIIGNGALTSLDLSSNLLTGLMGDDMSGNMLKRPV